MLVRLAELKDFDAIVHLIDTEFTKAGYGFVNRAQINTELCKKRIFVACIDETIVGVRIGKIKIWNLVVSSSHRGRGIGKALVLYLRPHTIRAKTDPVGHLSQQQKADFVDPSSFYEKLGFIFIGKAKSKNFWTGDTKGQRKRVYYTQGKKEHIKVYIDPECWLI